MTPLDFVDMYFVVFVIFRQYLVIYHRYWVHICLAGGRPGLHVPQHNWLRCVHLHRSSYRFGGISDEYKGLHGEWLWKNAMGAMVNFQVHFHVKILKGFLSGPWGTITQ
jgi:hypothetical protein